MRTGTDRFELLVRVRDALDRLVLLAITAAFTLVAFGAYAGDLDVPGGGPVLALYPLCLLAVDRLRPGSLVSRELRIAAGWSALVLVALWITPYLLQFEIIMAAAPFALVGSLLVAKLPAAATVVTVFLTAILGSFQAFVGIPLSPAIDAGIAALWIVLIGRVIVGRPYHFQAWPAIIGAGLYLLITLIDFFTADEFGVAWYGLRTTVWYMLGFLVLAYAGFSRETYRRIAFGFVAVTALVAAYAVFRWVVGPAGPERTLAMFSGGGINVDPIDKHLKVVGSFLTGHQLGFWCAFMAPACTAYALWARGWRRALALAAVALCVLAMIASESRGPLVGFVVGLALVLGLYQFSRAYPGVKAVIVALVVLGIGVLSAGIFMLGEADPERLDRYARILTPGEDPTFIQRELKWEQILAAVEKEPFGHGLGTGSSMGSLSGRYVQASMINIDNSYLKVAYEQGVIVMALFVAAMLGLLVSLAVASLRTRRREAAAMGFAGCGALASMLVSFYTGLYIEAAPALGGWFLLGLGLAYFVARSDEEIAFEAEARAEEARARRIAIEEERERRRPFVPRPVI